ncbi:UDP-N-acetylglucosamine 2-epimerase (non-hydrolyzing), partial [bacterium]|nr:UDP-N-acetylglucosamine 2-epimerase (non-hydrolyzing) [bacterium]
MTSPNQKLKAPIIDLVVATRPNFVKAGPLHRALEQNSKFQARLIHTGQHYDKLMSDVFFDDLRLPEATVNLGIGSGTHGFQTGQTLEAYEKHLLATRPLGTIVFGDVNATLACSLAAVKIGTPVAHVEAGLRSFDMTMPEEINRRLTDVISDLCFVTENAGLKHLKNEGIPSKRCILTGNIMVDAVTQFQDRLKPLTDLPIPYLTKQYGLLTIHRPVNVDNAQSFLALLKTVVESTQSLPLVFPVHPRTEQMLKEPEIELYLNSIDSSKLCRVKPFGYLDMLSALSHSACILSDSGGIQSEATTLGIPCLSLRETTEQPATISHGTVTLVGSDLDRIATQMSKIFARQYKLPRSIPCWDGHTS